MKTIELNNREISVPTTWNEITLGEYEKWQIKKVTDQLSYLQRIADICNIELEELLDAPMDVFEDIKANVQFILNPNIKASETIIIDNVAYSLSSYNGLTVGEWLDLEDIENNQLSSPLANSLAIICRPLGEVFDSENVEQRAKLFSEQSCDKILPLIQFLQDRKLSLQATINSSVQVIEDANQFLSMVKAFDSHGDGIKRLSFLQRKRYSSLLKSLEGQLSMHSVS